MMGRTHTAGGFLAGAGTVLLLNQIPGLPETGAAGAAAFAAVSAAAALLPDVDEKNSTAGRKLFLIPLALGIIKLLLLPFEYIGTRKTKKKIKTIRKNISHRGLFHSLPTWGILSAVFTAAGILLYVNLAGSESRYLAAALTGFLPGYLSHLLLDMVAGKIMLFAPFSTKYYGLALIKTNGIVENLLVFPALTALCGLFCYGNFKELLTSTGNAIYDLLGSML